MARETGICPIREELYAQCFDELIRQITIDCAERGFLLVRVRDEIKMTIHAYQTLYESSIAYGMRKALMAEYHKNEMQQRITDLTKECKDNETEIAMLQAKIESEIWDFETEESRENETHEKQRQHLIELNLDYKQELESILSTV